MSKNPYINALCAALYITLVALFFRYASAFANGKPDTVFAPMAVLSLLVLSVAFMGYAFFFRPMIMYMEGQKHEAIEFFMKTLACFAVITLVIAAIAFVA
jgi:hypothetical protein